MEDPKPKPKGDILYSFDDVEVYFLSDYHLNECIQSYADAFTTSNPLS